MKRHGFTIIEMLMVMAVMVILAGLVYPVIADLGASTQPLTMSATVKQVREQLELHKALGDVPVSMEGFPNAVEPAWFPGGRLPSDAWTMRPLEIQVVHGPKSARFPNKKTFKIRPDGLPGGHTAWYNAANGSFCVKVPDRGRQENIEEMFDLINGFETF